MIARRKIKKAVRFRVLVEARFTCRYCGRRAPEVILHVDHVIPLALNGHHGPDNFAVACEDCNLGKSDTPLPEHDYDELRKRAADNLKIIPEHVDNFCHELIEWAHKQDLKHGKSPDWSAVEAACLIVRALSLEVTDDYPGDAPLNRTVFLLRVCQVCINGRVYGENLRPDWPPPDLPDAMAFFKGWLHQLLSEQAKVTA